MNKPPNFICPLCFDASGHYNWGCLKEKGLVDHFFSKHQILLPTEEYVFSSEQEYQVWKDKVEVENNCTFICVRGSRVSPEGRCRKYYRCNKAGYYDGIRGKSRRMGAHCPASFTLNLEPDRPRYSVKYKPTHFGHPTTTSPTPNNSNNNNTDENGIEVENEQNSSPPSSPLITCDSSDLDLSQGEEEEVFLESRDDNENEVESETQMEFIPLDHPPENIDALKESIDQLIQHLLTRIGDDRDGLQRLLLTLSQHAMEYSLVPT